MDEVGEPGIAVVSSATLSGTAFTAYPDRDARVGFGVESEVVKIVVLTVIADVGLFGSEELGDDLKLLVSDAATILEGYCKSGEFFFHPSNANSHDEAAPRETVDGGGDSSPIERVAIGKDKNADA